MTAETSNARGEVVAWLRVRPDGTPDWAEDCIADDDRFLDPSLEQMGYRLRPLTYADATPPPPADAEVRARELYAEALRRRGLALDAKAIEGDNVFPPDEHGAAALDAIAAALSQPP